MLVTAIWEGRISYEEALELLFADPALARAAYAALDAHLQARMDSLVAMPDGRRLEASEVIELLELGPFIEVSSE